VFLRHQYLDFDAKFRSDFKVIIWTVPPSAVPYLNGLVDLFK
jgi:hypothetical protein